MEENFRVQAILKNKKGFTLVEILTVVSIILVLIVISMNAYFKSVEDAYLASDIAYVKSMLVEIEALILNGDFNLPDNTTSYEGATSTSPNYTGIITLTNNGTATSAFKKSTSSVATQGTENLDKVLAICGKHVFESNEARGGTSTTTSVIEIRYQVYKGIPYVYVWNKNAGTSDIWYPESYTCAGQLANEW